MLVWTVRAAGALVVVFVMVFFLGLGGKSRGVDHPKKEHDQSAFSSGAGNRKGLPAPRQLRPVVSVERTLEKLGELKDTDQPGLDELMAEMERFSKADPDGFRAAIRQGLGEKRRSLVENFFLVESLVRFSADPVHDLRFVLSMGWDDPVGDDEQAHHDDAVARFGLVQAYGLELFSKRTDIPAGSREQLVPVVEALATGGRNPVVRQVASAWLRENAPWSKHS